MFKKILIANRGEIARESIKNAHRLGICGIAFISLGGCDQTGTADVENNTIQASKEEIVPRTVPVPSVTPSPTSGSIIDGRSVDEHRESTYRPGVTVNFAYDQLLGGGYSSSWWISLDKRNGSWVDVYYETSEKLSGTGIVSFDCNGKYNVGVIYYGLEWGNADTKRLYIVKPSKVQEWQRESQNESWSDPFPPLPHQVYSIARKKLC